MELYDENIQKKKTKKKTSTIILVAIILLFVLILGITLLMATMKEDKFVAKVDGAVNNKILDCIVVDENNPNKIYISIRDIAQYLGYKDYSGEYDNLSESTNKCYIQSENEIANFALNSKQIYKKVISADSEYSLITIDEPVKAINGKLYTTIEGIEKAFNVNFYYSTDQKTLAIQTLPYLVNVYSSKVLDYGYEGMDEDFNNQKTVLQGYLIVHKAGKTALITTEGKKILEDKYERIQYLQPTVDFIVTSDGKVGLMSKTGETKIALTYDEIKLMDYNSKFYLVKKDGKSGIVDNHGNQKLSPDYDEIGIDPNNFKENGIKNGYILLNNLIPIKRDNLWGIINTSGKIVSELKYDDIGYIGSNSGTENNLLELEDYDVLIVKKNEKYTVITAKGQELWPAAFDSIYMTKTSGKVSYVMSANNNKWDLVQKLEESGIGKKKAINSDDSEETKQNTNTTEQSNTTDENQTSENETNEN